MSDDCTSVETSGTEAHRAADASVRLEVRSGRVVVHDGGDGSAAAQLGWDRDTVRVWLDGERVDAGRCRVAAGAAVRVEPVSVEPSVQYQVAISRDRMEACLRVVAEAGCRRALADAPATTRLALLVDEEAVEPDAPDAATAAAELQRAGVAHGIDPERVAHALEHPGEEVVVAVGTEPLEGRDGYLEHLVDFEALRTVGVRRDTPLVRRVHRREGAPGRDVTGRELSVPQTRDVRIRPGAGVSLDAQGVLAVASVDGAPHIDSEGHVEVRHELVLEVVDAVSGDIRFNGSIRVDGDVGEGRRVIARDELVVEGNVDRAHLESGSSMRVQGSVMSSVLRAGGERAVAATIADRVVELPRELGIVAAQARQIREQGAARGTDVSHGLSIQLVLERIHRGVLPSIASIIEDLREAGPAHCDAADMVSGWHRMLAAAAPNSLTPEQFGDILGQAVSLADEVHRATEESADLVISYMQSCQAEATGTVTLVGKGIFNSRVVAWGGMVAEQYEAVFRGGSIVSHGRVYVREIGSPAGAKTLVQLGATAELQADRACAGTIVTGPGYTHRFVADRSCIRIHFDAGGSMNVESLAA